MLLVMDLIRVILISGWLAERDQRRQPVHYLLFF
jgi:hypothetical protein